MNQVPVTKSGYKKLERELKDLKSIERPAVIQAIATAREHGDLSENAEYHAAREQQSFIEGRIQQLEAAISKAQIIDPSTLSGNIVKFGATVTIVDENTNDEETWQIVGDFEANTDEKRLSISAPVARALIGKSAGDSVAVKTPKGVRNYEVLKVIFQ